MREVPHPPSFKIDYGRRLQTFICNLEGRWWNQTHPSWPWADRVIEKQTKAPWGHYNSFLKKKNGQVTREAETFTLSRLTSISQHIRVSLQTQAGWEHVKKENQRASSLQEGFHLHGGRLVRSDGKCLGETSPPEAAYWPSSLTFQDRPLTSKQPQLCLPS